VTPEARDFASRLLQRNAILRATAEQSLNHVWLKQVLHDDFVTEEALSSFFCKLKAYAEFSTIKKISLFALAHLEMDARQAQSHDLFMKLDSNGDGLLGVVELRDACFKVGLAPPVDLQELLAASDFDQIGALDRTTFLSIDLDLTCCLGPVTIGAAFDLLDIHRIGQIIEGDWCQVAHSNCSESSGVGLSLEEFVTMLKGEGCIPPVITNSTRLRQLRAVSALEDTLALFMDLSVSFQHQHSVKKEILCSIAQLELTLRDENDEGLAPYLDVFDFLDSNGDGWLTPDKINKGCQKIEIIFPERIRYSLQSCSLDMSVAIDRTTFLAVMLDIDALVQSDIFRLAFEMFDLEGKGYIGLEDLQRCVRFPISAVQIDMIIRNEGQNGYIGFEQFVSMIRRDCCSSSYRKWGPDMYPSRMQEFGGTTDPSTTSMAGSLFLAHMRVPHRIRLPPAGCDVPSPVTNPSEMMQRPHSDKKSALDFNESGEFASTSCSTASTPRTTSSEDGFLGPYFRSEKIWRHLAVSKKIASLDPSSRLVEVSNVLENVEIDDDEGESIGSYSSEMTEHDIFDNGDPLSDSDDEDSSGEEGESSNTWRCRMCASRNDQKNFICQTCVRGQNPTFA